MIEVDGEEGKRRVHEVVQDGQALPLVAATEAEPDQEAHDEDDNGWRRQEAQLWRAATI